MNDWTAIDDIEHPPPWPSGTVRPRGQAGRQSLNRWALVDLLFELFTAKIDFLLDSGPHCPGPVALRPDGQPAWVSTVSQSNIPRSMSHRSGQGFDLASSISVDDPEEFGGTQSTKLTRSTADRVVVLLEGLVAARANGGDSFRPTPLSRWPGRPAEHSVNPQGNLQYFSSLPGRLKAVFGQPGEQ